MWHKVTLLNGEEVLIHAETEQEDLDLIIEAQLRNYKIEQIDAPEGLLN